MYLYSILFYLRQNGLFKLRDFVFKGDFGDLVSCYTVMINLCYRLYDYENS